MQNILKKVAFTLAEVLIVIGVIGIIADMTVPILKRDIDKMVYVTQLKKFFSTFQQGMKSLMADEGVSEWAHVSLYSKGSGDGMSSPSTIDPMIRKIFKVQKTCTASESNCPRSYKPLGKSANSDDINFMEAVLQVFSQFYNADGAIFTLALPDECSKDLFNLLGQCGYVIVDVNGLKKPNTWGYDAFVFWINTDGSLVPVYGEQWNNIIKDTSYVQTSWKDNTALCGLSGSSVIADNVSGIGCSARIIEEGWKMNY